jgi:hypothetical protein
MRNDRANEVGATHGEVDRDGRRDSDPEHDGRTAMQRVEQVGRVPRVNCNRSGEVTTGATVATPVIGDDSPARRKRSRTGPQVNVVAPAG